MVGSSIDCGAPSRRDDSGWMFSSSAMVGNDGFAATARAVGDTISPTPEGDMMGDFAGLLRLVSDRKGGRDIDSSPPVVAALEQLLQAGNALVQRFLLQAPCLPFRAKCLMQQLNGVCLLVDQYLQVLLTYARWTARTCATHVGRRS